MFRNMVLVERNAENVRNGRRSRGPSPNGHGGTPDSSSDDDSTKKIGNKSSKSKSEYEEKIRVGRDYQAVCPDLVPAPDRKPEGLNDRALLVWSPTKDIPESKLEEYISVAKEKYGYNGEQALGMLFWHKHDLERAVLDLANFTPFPDEWTVEDKVLFEQAFQFHGKSFHRIRQMLPDKSIASLVKYYYSWKKTRSRTSVMDRQEKSKTKEGSENGSENGSNEESDSDEKKWPYHRGIRRASGSPPLGGNDDHGSAGGAGSTPSNQALAAAAVASASIANGIVNTGDTSEQTKELAAGGTDSNKPLASSNSASGAISSCVGCGVACSITNKSPHGALCNSCFHHWRRTGSLRPTSGPFYGKRSRVVNSSGAAGVERHKRKPPRGMYINHDDIVALASPDNEPATANRGDDLLAGMDREINTLLSQIQNNKQTVSILKRRSDSIEELRPNEPPQRISSRWNNDELMLAVQGVRKFGKDFPVIAEIIGTKSESQVRTFFVNYRRRYNLDALLKEFEAAKRQELEEEIVTVGVGLDAAVIRRQEPEIMEIDLDDDAPVVPLPASQPQQPPPPPPLPPQTANGKDDDDVEEVIITDPTN